MDFFDLRPNIGASPAKPRIRTVNKNVLINIPAALAEHVGLDGAKAVKVQFGQDDQSAAIRIKAEEGAPWELKVRKKEIQLYVAEVLPTETVTEQEVDYTEADGALVLTLPKPWTLANALAIKRPNGKRGGKGS